MHPGHTSVHVPGLPVAGGGLLPHILACLVLCVPAPALGQGAKTELEKVLHRPGPMPDRIVLTWKGDPARTLAVTWRTDTNVRKALAQVALADAKPILVTSATTVTAVTVPLKTDLGEALYHTAQFENLNPRTKYVYRVGDGSLWNEWSHFLTASERPEPFSFLYFGDAQNDIRQHWSRLLREAYATCPRARFTLHAGDLINIANRDAEWGEWSQAAGWINLTVPVVPTPGNHEYIGTQGGKADLGRHWRAQFALPEHGPPGLEETTYYFDYQGVRFVSLNSNEKVAEQVPWLERVLGNNPNRWTIVTFHHPVLASVAGRDNEEVRRRWQPIFDRYRVDLVLQGHDHSYGRSGLRGSDGQSTFPGSEAGTVYVVSVSGPKMYPNGKGDWMRRRGEGIQLFQVISVDGDRLRFEARTAVSGDAPYDQFELHKRRGQPNLLVDPPPDPIPSAPVVRNMEPLSLRMVLFLVAGSAAVAALALLVARRRAAAARARTAASA